MEEWNMWHDKALGEHFIGKYNIIYERDRFGRRCQQPGEGVENFITVIEKLAVKYFHRIE